MLDFVAKIVQRLTISENDIHVGIVSFSDKSQIEFKLNTYYDKSVMINAIRAIKYIGSFTHTAAGLLDMRTRVFDPTKQNIDGDRPDVPNIAVVITDGESNENQDKTIPYADDAKDDGITVLVVGITSEVNEAELKGISSDGVEGSTYWKSPTFKVTDTIIQSIVRKSCGGGKINYFFL